HVTINFQRGTTAISGSNGAGKTTLVEAIGFALFDSMPYKQDQFVREGEKYGRVVVHLIGSDDRPYVVERRCGSGALWTLFDPEANLRLEQRADVQDKLHELFGIERERSLENLFRDALGVPQGTFTSSFLQKPAARKQTFDALLQIEDYRNAFEYLLEAQKQYKEQTTVQEREIQRLTFETRDLETWRTSLKANRELDQDLKERNRRATLRLHERQSYQEQLKQRRDYLQQCQTRRDQSTFIHESNNKQLELAEAALKLAQAAHQAVEESRSDYERYRQTEVELARLRQEERQRNALRQQQASLNNTLATTRAHIQHFQQRLDEVARARQLVLDLLPAVERQGELDLEIARLKQEVQRYEELRKEGARLYQAREKSQNELSEVRRRITEIEQLQPLADLLAERSERVTLLKSQSEQRQDKRLQLEEKQQTMQEKQNELKQALSRLNKAEKAIEQIEAHRQEAEEYALILKQQQRLENQQHHLRGNIESYTDSRNRSAGGQCPLLHQTCLNIQQHGQLSLEAYFDGLLAEEQEQLATIVSQLNELTTREAAIKKYAEGLEKLGQFVEQRDGNAERIERLNVELRRLEREAERLRNEWESLQHIDQEIRRAQALQTESENASRQTHQLSGFYTRETLLCEQIEQYTQDFEERRNEAEPLKQSRALLEERQRELEALNDPRGQSKGAQAIIQPEATHRQQLREEEQVEQRTIQQLNELALALEAYARLDQQIAAQEVEREQATPGHQRYLKNIDTANSLPTREQTHAEARSAAEQSARALAQAQAAYEQAAAAFNAQEFQEVESEIKQLGQEIAGLAERMEYLQKDINDLEQKIAGAELLLLDLEAAQKERQTLDELGGMMEQFRRLIKDAAPHVLRAMLNDISAEANRIFGEIMGDRSAQLSWSDDYEVTLIRQGIKRSFAQLSGGEQMSAALAVRLALLKKLSSLNLAFFDEPTQNMDEQRRSNLAEQIRRVRGFDQLIVISHDDTFEQGLDSLIRLRKLDGQTRQLNEDDDVLMASNADMAEDLPVLVASPDPVPG
ncbi:MAG TPA: SMC family ATPase, partial [Ktedonobacteraceae bacterium]|nr:SMC family ATPase [Ktedonobacteraceae bacterium]